MESNTHLVTEQVAPTPNDRPAMWPLVIKDMEARDSEGRKKYKTPLQPFNGRDALVDAYQELLDGAVYLRQLIFEKENAKPELPGGCLGPEGEEPNRFACSNCKLFAIKVDEDGCCTTCGNDALPYFDRDVK